MALQSTGSISFSQIQTEHGGTSPISLSEYYQGGSNVINDGFIGGTIPTSGQISAGGFRGSRYVRRRFITANTNNLTIDKAWLQGSGWDGTRAAVLVIYINSGVTVGSTAYTNPALTFDGTGLNSSIHQVLLYNSGTIFGAGGVKGSGGYAYQVDTKPGGYVDNSYQYYYTATAGTAGTRGGTALKTNFSLAVYNYGSIYAGGGGGGGGGGYGTGLYYHQCARTRRNAGCVSSCNAGECTCNTFPACGSNSGGRNCGNCAGWVGLATANGGSGGNGYGSNNTDISRNGPSASGGGYGGFGGSIGQAGGAGSVGSTTNGGAGGAAGYYVDGHSKITWSVTGNIAGNIIN